MAWVYILQCADDSYYTGMTRSEEPDQRLSEHQMKLSPSAYTASRLPVRLVYSEYFDVIADAIFAERKIMLNVFHIDVARDLQTSFLQLPETFGFTVWRRSPIRTYETPRFVQSPSGWPSEYGFHCEPR